MNENRRHTRYQEQIVWGFADWEVTIQWIGDPEIVEKDSEDVYNKPHLYLNFNVLMIANQAASKILKKGSENVLSCSAWFVFF